MKACLFISLLLQYLPFAAHAAEKPNVILIYSDDQGYGDASCLNPDSKFRTRNLDRLAREGLTLTDGHCSDTVCTPSRCGLLTDVEMGAAIARAACASGDVPRQRPN